MKRGAVISINYGGALVVLRCKDCGALERLRCDVIHYQRGQETDTPTTCGDCHGSHLVRSK